MRLPWFSKLKYLVTGNSALRELTVNAERGDAVAQNLLGSIYALTILLRRFTGIARRRTKEMQPLNVVWQ